MRRGKVKKVKRVVRRKKVVRRKPLIKLPAQEQRMTLVPVRVVPDDVAQAIADFLEDNEVKRGRRCHHRKNCKFPVRNSAKARGKSAAKWMSGSQNVIEREW